MSGLGPAPPLPTTPDFASSPPPTSFAKLSFPAEHVLLITLSRPKSLNCINTAGHQELHAIYEWFDHEPALRVAILTGEGRAFSAGADLKEWNDINASTRTRNPMPSSGFGALSMRTGLKPVICAINGICYGGGFEMAINADILLASHSATLGLPEVKRGLIALAGALPRLTRVVGRQRAMEMSLTGRAYTAQTMHEWGVVNKVVAGGNKEVVAEAVRWAVEIAGNSPDAVVVSRQGVMIGWEGYGAQEGAERIRKEWFPRIEGRENMVEGIRAFVEKRSPQWVGSKL